ncbi:unnamed protein product, partial [Symbiodinium microadriaticum]
DVWPGLLEPAPGLVRGLAALDGPGHGRLGERHDHRLLAARVGRRGVGGSIPPGRSEIHCQW